MEAKRIKFTKREVKEIDSFHPEASKESVSALKEEFNITVPAGCCESAATAALINLREMKAQKVITPKTISGFEIHFQQDALEHKNKAGART